MKPTAKKSVPPSPTITVGQAKKKQQRSHFSTIINLLVLVALFTFVFALQHIGNKSSDKTAPTAATTEEVEEAPSEGANTAKRDDKGRRDSDTVKTAVVDLPTRSTARPARTYAPRRSAAKKRARGIGWEDRRQSASLVDRLDGNYRHTTTSTTSYQPAASTAPYQPRTTRNDLDSEIARQRYLSANQGVAAAPPPQVAQPLAYTSAPAQRTYVTQPNQAYATQSRKPSWEVTTSE